MRQKCLTLRCKQYSPVVRADLGGRTRVMVRRQTNGGSQEPEQNQRAERELWSGIRGSEIGRGRAGAAQARGGTRAGQEAGLAQVQAWNTCTAVVTRLK